MAGDYSVIVTGVEELDRALTEMVAGEGKESAKAINAVMKKAIRDAVNTIVKPAVMALIPWETGFLESQIKVRATTRSRNRMGFWVGFPDPLFQGDTFYGGFIEFGWDHRLGVTVEADSFLRRALYPNVNQIIEFVRNRVKEWVDLNNSIIA